MPLMKSWWNVGSLLTQALVTWLQSIQVLKRNPSCLAWAMEIARAERPPLTIRILTQTARPNQLNSCFSLTYAVSIRVGQSKPWTSSASTRAPSKQICSTCALNLIYLASRTWMTKSLRVNTMTTRTSFGSSEFEILQRLQTLSKRPLWGTRSLIWPYKTCRTRQSESDRTASTKRHNSCEAVSTRKPVMIGTPEIWVNLPFHPTLRASQINNRNLKIVQSSLTVINK